MNTYTLVPGSRSRLGALRRILVRCLVFLLLGAAVNVVVAYALGLFVDVSQGRTESAGSWAGHSQWMVTRWARNGAAYLLSVREPGGDWSPGQATGPPDTPTGGDQVTAWASQSADGQAEWLLLEYAGPVAVKAVQVYEIYSAGALNKITMFTPSGEEVEAWSGIDPTPRGSRIATSEVPIRPGLPPTKKIRIHLDSANVPNWNEIDAVGLVDQNGKVHWAVAAEASSTYASNRSGVSLTGAGASALAPEWTGLHVASDEFARRDINHESRAIDARGWPMLSLWGHVPSGRSNTPGVATVTFLGGGSPPPSTLVTLKTRQLGGRLSAVAGPRPGEPPLLLHPIWRGFLFNTVFYAIVLVVLYYALTVPRRLVKEVSRMRRGCCIACGYDLDFDFIPGCPECGWRRGEGRAAGRMTNHEVPTTNQ